MLKESKYAINELKPNSENYEDDNTYYSVIGGVFWLYFLIAAIGVFIGLFIIFVYNNTLKKSFFGQAVKDIKYTYKRMRNKV